MWQHFNVAFKTIRCNDTVLAVVSNKLLKFNQLIALKHNGSDIHISLIVHTNCASG